MSVSPCLSQTVAFTTIYRFPGGASGGGEPSSLILGEAGSLYGASSIRGSSTGLVFHLIPAAAGGDWTEYVIENITGYAELVNGQGSLFGSTANGGGYGTVFQLNPPSSSGATWAEAVLYTFTGGSDGQHINPIVRTAKGEIFGLASDGGALGQGTAYKLTPPDFPGGSWTETTLYAFAGPPNDAGHPVGALAVGPGGVLYGVSGGGTVNAGTVFSLTPPATSGGAWTEAVLVNLGHNFGGQSPQAGPVIGPDGALYCVTQLGATGGNGTVISVRPPAQAGLRWSEQVLHQFTGQPDGSQPWGQLILSSGILYGTTARGGTSNLGTIFSLTPPASPGGAWTEVVVHSFSGLDGSGPTAGLTSSPNGTFFGTTTYGGYLNNGTVFSFVP